MTDLRDDPFPIDDDFGDVLVEVARSLPDARGRCDGASATNSRRTTTSEKGPSQATRLVQMVVGAGVELFHTPDGTPYATFEIDGHFETWALRSKAFRRFMGGLYYGETNSAPGANATTEALLVLEAKAAHEGPEHEVHVRVAQRDGKIYIDLGNARWEVVEISPEGWVVLPVPPVKFRRTKGTAALPHPIAGGRVEDLRRYVNVASDTDFVLLVAFILSAMRATGPFPILVVVGEQGRGKTVVMRFIRGLADPACPAVRAEPRNPRELAITAQGNWLIALDNLSHVPPWLSDCLCRLSTGGGFGTRELYSDDEEALFDSKRPAVLNGIEDVVVRGDLLDRAVTISLGYLSETTRRPESELVGEYERALPGILGAFYGVVAGALRDLPTTKLERLPRMADLALWIHAAERSLGWAPGTFAKAYAENREDHHHLALESSQVGSKLRELVALHGDWEGTISDLLAALNETFPKSAAGKPIVPEKWPKTARGLTGSIRRIAPSLRAVGINAVDGGREPGTGRRLVTIRQVATEPATPTTSLWETL